MASNYKNILTGYINTSVKGDGKYLSIKNVSDQPVVINPGEKISMSMTPENIKEQYPNTPDFKKSVKVEQQEIQPDPDSPKYELRNDGSIKGVVEPMDFPF